MNKDKMTQQVTTNSQPLPFQGQKWLVEERDACGVGFIAYKDGRAAHSIVAQAVTALGCMEHRGGCSADRDTGDGSGIMASLPVKIFEQWFESQGKTLPPQESWGVGMVFMHLEEEKYQAEKAFVEATIAKHGLTVEGWRVVPINPGVLGEQAKENQPRIEQVVVTSPEGLTGDELDRRLYIARSEVGKRLDDFFYICSFSCRTVVYKGMVRANVLSEFYQDLTNPDYEATFALYHRRFSTNTMPKWPLAQPMRMLGHNGEINTLLGNINWMAS
ncbi:MAG: glutamate synthase subunit alpha, partial [Synechococcaceae cyanobacterium RL_1_2]|nr:glutamate synthase subunit alpha [Synechococcaceae cyanobacterium RL_1_2]